MEKWHIILDVCPSAKTSMTVMNRKLYGLTYGQLAVQISGTLLHESRMCTFSRTSTVGVSAACVHLGSFYIYLGGEAAPL